MKGRKRTKAEFKEMLEADRRILLQEGTRGLTPEQREIAIKLHSSTPEGGKHGRRANH